jgi:hypothetical protein
MLRRTIHLASLAALACAAAPAGAAAQKALGKAAPSLSSVTDSAALAGALAALPGRPASGGARYSVRFGSSGAPAEVVILSGPATPFDSAVAAMVRERLSQPSSASPGEFLYLDASWGELPVLRTHVSAQYSVPELLNPRVIEQGLGTIAMRFAGQVAGGRVQVPVRLEVGLDGVPRSITLDRTTGIPELDSDLVSLLGLGRYQPAVMDGHPAAVWVSFQVDLVLPPAPIGTH